MNFRKEIHGKPKYQCKLCQNEYVKNYNRYKRPKGYKQKRRKEIHEWFDELKRKPCTDCGGTFPIICMDFDHLDANTKICNLATLVGDGYSKERILAEIAKCDLVCSNCHRIRTEKRRLNG
jgi:hypothetical protein